MKHPDKLFALVKSLSVSEIKQFKIYISKGKSSSDRRYIDLFNQIIRQKYFETIKSIEGDNNNISFIKNYLYNSLLDFLESNHTPDPIEYSVNKLINKAKIVYERGMYYECENLLATAKTIAIKYELFLKIKEICDIELMLVPKINSKKIKEFIDEIIKTKFDAINKYKIQTEYYKTFSQVNHLFLQYQLLKKHEWPKEIKAIMNYDIMLNYELAQTFFSKYYYFASHQLFYALTDKDSFELKKDHLKLWDDNPDMKEKNPSLYFNIMSNYMNSCDIKHDYIQFSYALKKSRELVMESENSKINYTFRLYLHQAEILINQGNVAKLEKLTE